jgi:hypothetical protein
MSDQQDYDLSKWKRGINAAELDTDEINAFIDWKLTEYNKDKWRDDNMWEVYLEDFNTFTVDTFKACQQTLIRKLRSHLRSNGVWVKVDRRVTVAQSLFETLGEEDPTEWSNTEMREQLKKEGFNSYRLPSFQRQTSLSRSPTPTAPPAPPPASELPPELPSIEQPVDTPETPTQEFATPSATLPATSGFGKELANLAKLYTEESKYSGEDDNFDYKLTIFHDLCDRADVLSRAKTKAFPTMLRGLALGHYYLNINIRSTSPPSFDDLCNLTRQYFEGAEYKRGVLARWNPITLRQVMDKNPDKSAGESLQILIKDLRHLQHGLDSEFHTDKFLHNKLIDTCQGIPACQYACYKPADSLAGLINDLRSSITTYNKSHSESTSTFFTDRRHHKWPDQDQRHPFNTTAKPYNKKRCFVCDQEGYWSTQHSKEEREEATRQYKERLRKRFEGDAKQFITEYEGRDSNGYNEEETLSSSE